MGRREDILARVRAISEPIIAREGIELLDLELLGSGRRSILRFVIDKPGGVNLDDCSNVSRAVEGALEVDDPLDNSYQLEVSSPGLDRPLTKPEHYARYAGQKVTVKTFAPVENRRSFTGTLKGLTEDQVVLDVDGREQRLPLTQVAKANLKFELNEE